MAEIERLKTLFSNDIRLRQIECGKIHVFIDGDQAITAADNVILENVNERRQALKNAK